MNEVNIETSTKEQIAFELMTTIAHASCSSKGKFKKKQKSEKYWLELYEKCLFSVLNTHPQSHEQSNDQSHEKPLEKSSSKLPLSAAIAKQNSAALAI